MCFSFSPAWNKKINTKACVTRDILHGTGQREHSPSSEAHAHIPNPAREGRPRRCLLGSPTSNRVISRAHHRGQARTGQLSATSKEGPSYNLCPPPHLQHSLQRGAKGCTIAHGFCRALASSRNSAAFVTECLAGAVLPTPSPISSTWDPKRSPSCHRCWSCAHLRRRRRDR